MKKKVLLIALAAILLVGASIGGTLAWLTAKTDTITNTFTVGNITMSLSETARTYKIVPGAEISKDPKITITAGSEKCYVFVKIDNNLKLTINNAETVVGTPNIVADNWKLIDGSTNIYAYYGGDTSPKAVDASETEQILEVFTQVTIDGDLVTETNIGSLKDKTIKITAYAHQSDNTDYAAAMAAAKALTW